MVTFPGWCWVPAAGQKVEVMVTGTGTAAAPTGAGNFVNLTSRANIANEEPRLW